MTFDLKKLNDIRGFSQINPSCNLESSFFFSVKSAIAVRGFVQNAGSKILGRFVPTEDAEVVAHMIKLGGEFIGTTLMDEFGVGSFCENTYFPLSLSWRKCGGSSGGSAYVSRELEDIEHISIAESTGGSVATPASFENIWSFTPSYGLISRDGVIAYAHTLDKVGFMSRNRDLLYKISQALIYPEVPYSKDPTVVRRRERLDLRNPIYFLDPLFIRNSEARDRYKRRLELMDLKGSCISASIFVNALPLYSAYTAAELYSNLIRFDGNYYEIKNMDYKNRTNVVRSRYFSTTLKKFLRGMDTIARYPELVKERQTFEEEMRSLLGNFSFLVLPGLYSFPSEVEDDSLQDTLTIAISLCNFPHVVVPDPEGSQEDGKYMPLIICSMPYTDHDLLSFTLHEQKY